MYPLTYVNVYIYTSYHLVSFLHSISALYHHVIPPFKEICPVQTPNTWTIIERYSACDLYWSYDFTHLPREAGRVEQDGIDVPVPS